MKNELASQAVAELDAAFRSITDEQVTRLARQIHAANQVVLFGGGREGLALRGWTMRLYHAGISAHYLGDVTCPPVSAGDIVILSSGPGLGAITTTIAALAKEKGATTILATALPQSTLADLCDGAFVIDAQTMASDQDAKTLLPMGTAFETALLVAGDLVASQVVAIRGEKREQMRERHANLE